MPGYAGSGQAVLIRSGQQVFLFQQETGVVGKASIALLLERIPHAFASANGVSLQASFTNVNGTPADPGAFEIDLQTSDLDQDVQYCNASAWKPTTLNANFVGRVEISFYARYARVFVKSMTNSVYLTVLATTGSGGTRSGTG